MTKGEITKEESCSIKTSLVQQKMVFLLFVVFKTNSVSGIVLPQQQGVDKSLFQFSS